MSLNILSTKDTVPLSTSGSGNITTNGRSFVLSVANDVKIGDWIYDATGEEVRLVTWLGRDGVTGQLDSAFTSDLSAASLAYVERDSAKIISMSIFADQGSASEIEGVALSAGATFHRSSTDGEGKAGIKFVRPRVVDGTVGAVSWTVQTKGVAY